MEPKDKPPRYFKTLVFFTKKYALHFMAFFCFAMAIVILVCRVL